MSTALSKFDELDARRGADPNSIANNLFSYCMRNLLLRDTSMVAERADELFSISIQHEMRVFLIAATFFRGWAIAAAGRGEEGIAEMRRSIPEVMVSGALVWPPLLLPTFVESCGKSGRVDEGLDWVTKGLATAEQTGLRVVEAELHRLKGELRMIKNAGDVVEAECCLRTAIDVARRQSARLFELRATISLARVLKQQGKTDEARRMLTEIHNWFTEGFDTADLKDAKALLNELLT